MCGRYRITLPPELFRSFYGYQEQPNFPSQHNVSPTQTVPVVLQKQNGRTFQTMRWGLIPSWTKDLKTLPLMINARSETICQKPAFRQAFQKRRCIFLSDGFYEWKTEGKVKTPYVFLHPDNEPLPLAGIWEEWLSPQGIVCSAAIVTTQANGTVSQVHDRMPVILTPDLIDIWLDENSYKNCETVMKPYSQKLTIEEFNFNT